MSTSAQRRLDRLSIEFSMSSLSVSPIPARHRSAAGGYRHAHRSHLPRVLDGRTARPVETVDDRVRLLPAPPDTCAPAQPCPRTPQAASRVSSHPHSLRQHDVHFVHVPHHAVDQVVRVAVQRRKTRVAETARRLAVNAARSAWTVFRSVFRSVFLRTRLGRLRVTRWRVARARTISIGGLAVGDRSSIFSLSSSGW